MFTIADLLKMKEIEGIHLVAGKGGIENPIFCIDIIDNPDSYDWLLANQLLLSSGFIFQDNLQLQEEIIPKLAAIGCAGLGMKINRFLPGFPDVMIQAANKLNFPLLELPYGYSMSLISRTANRLMSAKNENDLQRIVDIQKNLNISELKSNCLSEITRIAVSNLQNPILIFDDNWNLISWQDHPDNPYPLEEYLSLKKRTQVLSNSFTDDIPHNFHMFHKPVARALQLDEKTNILCRIIPIVANEAEIYGFIVVWETVHTLDSTDFIVLEQIAINTAIERLRMKELEETKLRLKRDFFDELLSGEIESLTAIRSLAEVHGLNINVPYRCIIIRYAWDNPEVKLMQHRKLNRESSHCAEISSRIAHAHGISMVSVTYSTRIILLLEALQQESAAESHIQSFVENLYEEIRKQMPDHPVMIIVSPIAKDITKIAEAYDEAQQSAHLFKNITDTPIIYSDDFSVFRLLSKNIDSQILLDFAKKALDPLITYDKENNTHLMQTLDMYFLQLGNTADIAKKMYIHRNTCLYRIEKIKSVLNDDFRNSQNLLKYQLALLILRSYDL